jgi:hypothetical protein
MQRQNLVAILLGCAVLLFVIVPGVFVSAQQFPGDGGVSGIVPCGDTDAGEQPCQACHVIGLAEELFDLIIFVAVFIAVIMIAFAGYKYITAQGDTGKVSDAHKLFRSVTIGLIIILSAWTVVDVLLKTFYGGQLGPWNSIDCVAQPANTTGGQQQGGVAVGPGGATGGGGGRCTAASASSPCSVESLQSRGGSWGDASVASTMSTICNRESGGNPLVRPSTDLLWNTQGQCPSGTTGSGVGGQCGFSFGLFQINIAANRINCGGQELNCPSAFRLADSSCRPASWCSATRPNCACGASGFGMQIANQDLYNRCVAAAQNPQCNTENAQRMYDQAARRGNGLAPWRSDLRICGI